MHIVMVKCRLFKHRLYMKMMNFLMNMDWNRNYFTDQLFPTEESWSIFMEFSVLSMEVMGWQL